jgi:hypothetical protein
MPARKPDKRGLGRDRRLQQACLFCQDAFHIEVADNGWAEAQRDSAQIERERREGRERLTD